MLGSVCRRELILVVHIEQVRCLFHLDAEFIDTSCIGSEIHVHGTVPLQLDVHLLSCEQVNGAHLLLRQSEEVEGVGRDIHAGVDAVGSKVHHHEQHFVLELTQEGELMAGIELPGLWIDIHQIEELPLAHSSLAVGDMQDLLVFQLQVHLVLREMTAVEIAAADGVYAPVVEDRRTAVTSREALGIHPTLAELLPGIDHERITAHECGDDDCRNGFHTVSAEEITGNALLVVVLQEVEHVWADVVNVLPVVGDAACRAAVADDVAQTVVHAHLVVEIVKSRLYVGAIQVGVVYLSDEDDTGIALLDDAGGVGPEGRRHHLRHVAAEAVDVF